MKEPLYEKKGQYTYVDGGYDSDTSEVRFYGRICDDEYGQCKFCRGYYFSSQDEEKLYRFHHDDHYIGIDPGGIDVYSGVIVVPCIVKCVSYICPGSYGLLEKKKGYYDTDLDDPDSLIAGQTNPATSYYK